jgi:hypothetical protein
MASKINAVKAEIRAVEKNVDRIAEIQNARLYWAQLIEDLKNTKIDVAGKGQRNYIWITSFRLTPSLATAVEYIPDSVDMAGSMYVRSVDETVSGGGRRGTTTRADKRPWVIMTGYVKIPDDLPGNKPAATRRAEALMKALQNMGQSFICQKDHRYQEDSETGYLIPVSADKGPARAYRYLWDEENKEVVLAGLLTVEAAGDDENASPAEEWKELARDKSRRKPDWIAEGFIPENAVGVPCPIELARSEGRSRRPISRTDGYLDEVEVRWLELRSDKLARFTIFAKFADTFEYPKKSTML